MATNYGLTGSGGQPVPLKKIEVNTNIRGFVASIETRLLYSNEEDNPIEAKFVFPVDDHSAVYKFEAIIEGRLIIGECQEKEEAKQTYQDAIAAGQSAFLLEESDAAGDVFECHVGNLPPHTDAEICFAYVVELGLEQKDGAAKFVYPAVLGCRYQPTAPATSTASSSATTGAQPTSSTSGHSEKRPPKFRSVEKDALPYTFSFNGEIQGSQEVEKLVADEEGDEFQLKFPVASDKTCAQITLKSQFQFDHDLIFYVKYADAFKPHVVMEPGLPNSSEWFMQTPMVMLNFVPNLHDVTKSVGRGEYIFIVDRSGSMGGDRILSARQAMKEFLQQLPKDCYFNIVSFGSHFTPLFTSSEKNNTTSMKKAVKLQKQLDANFGGTEMLRPFEHVYDQPTIKGYPRQIFLLTDGGIWNTNLLLDLVKKHQNSARVFTFGIGSGASTTLVKGIARAGKGKAEFITDDLTGLPEKVKKTLEFAMQPHVSNVALKVAGAGAASIEHIPQKLPPIFFGERLIVYALITNTTKAKNKNLSLLLTGDMEGKKLRYQLDFKTEGETSAEGPIHRLGAKAKIKEYEDAETKDEEKKKEIVLLSRAANIISKYTAFIGVDKGRVEKIRGQMETREVPLAGREATREKKKKKKKSKSRKRKASDSRSASEDEDDEEDSTDRSAGVPIKIPRPPPPPPPAPGPSLYGGGSADAEMANKYLGGIKDVAVPSIGDDDPNPSPRRSAPPTYKRKRKAGFTHRKRHKKPLETKHVVFAKWGNGHYYAAERVKTSESTRRLVKFKDGQTTAVTRSNCALASVLSPGDVVGVEGPGSAYELGVVSEYDIDTDAFVVANMSGLVQRQKAQDLMVPNFSARRMRTRKVGSAEPGWVCLYGNEDKENKGTIKVTTSDLAELRHDGWINKTIVDLALRYMWENEISPDLAARTAYLDPAMMSTLLFEVLLASLEDDLGYGTRSNTRSVCRDLAYAKARDWLQGINLRNLDFLFVPIFDEVHWYLIGVRIEKRRDGSLRMKFLVMDSYFTCARFSEIAILEGVLDKLCEDQGLAVTFDPTPIHPEVPVQENESDCGLSMLEFVWQCFQDDLSPAPHLNWFCPTALQNRRHQLSKVIMELWLQQTWGGNRPTMFK